MARQKATKSQNTEIQELNEGPTLEQLAAKEKELNDMRKSVKYNFQKHAQKIHSLYKLEPAKFKKNVSYTDVPEWQEAEHVHFFHSIDSNGQEQKQSVPVGGHFHEMILVKPATENEPPVYECSPPLRKARQRNAEGQWVIVNVPSVSHDNHTHEVTYKHSEVWTKKAINPEFAKLQQMMAAKMPTGDAGIQEG